MKLETTVLILKAASVTLVGVFTPWAGSLSQWIGDGSWPPKIVWVGVIMPLSVIGGASALSAFLSQAFGNYLKSQNGKQPDTAPAQLKAP